jgi:hypothetical protein
MKSFSVKQMGISVWVLFSLACFEYLVAGGEALAASKPSSCPACHSDLKSILPKNHAAVSGREISACTSCHAAKNPDKTEPNSFSARLHRAHIGSQAKVDCLTCHTWAPGKSFGLIKQKESWGNPSRKDMDLIRQMAYSWSKSSFLDSLHAKRNVTCAGCHGKRLPAKDDTVENERCLSCHGSYEKLAEKTASVEFPKRNPHKSHLLGLACTKCHTAHGESRVYCLECHREFQMKISGGRINKLK